MEFGPLVREDYPAKCSLCGKSTYFSHVNPSGAHVPCCSDCHHRLMIAIDEEADHNTIEPVDSKAIPLGCLFVIAIVLIIITAFARASC